MTFLLILKSIIAAIGIALATSPIGVFVLWKRMAYFADAVSHSAIFGLAIATILAILPIYGIVICAVIFCFLIFFINKISLYSTDSMIGIVSYSLMSIGMILLAIFPNEIELEEYLFGDLINLTITNIIMIYLIAGLVLLSIITHFEKLLLATINSDLAKISGIDPEKLQLKFLLLTAFVVACLVKIVGIFLIMSIIILPAAIARNFSKTPKEMLFAGIISSVIVMSLGAGFSMYFELPSSPSIITFAAIVLILSITVPKLRGRN